MTSLEKLHAHIISHGDELSNKAFVKTFSDPTEGDYSFRAFVDGDVHCDTPYDEILDVSEGHAFHFLAWLEVGHA